MTVQKALELICQQSNLEKYQAWWILEFVTKKDKTALVGQEYTFSEEQKNQLNSIITDLTIHHKPLAYILGFVPFLNLHITVKPPILIPRPETEEWVQNNIAQLKKEGFASGRILDIGTGSGCIALAFAQAFAQASVVASDINPQALELAQHNAKQNNISNITCVHSDLFEKLRQSEKFDLIVSNPPYIARNQLEKMSASVTKWEDHNALFAHDHGLALIKKIITNAQHWLLPSKNSYNLIIEIAEYHQPALEQFLQDLAISNYLFTVDHFNNIRTVQLLLTMK